MNDLKLDTEILKSGSVAIFGDGVSGKGVSSLLRKMNWEHKIFSQEKESFNPNRTQDFSLVVKSPGFSQDHEWVLLAEERGLPVLGELDFASTFISNPIVAVTGTNGKSTMVTFLRHLWEIAGRPAKAAGNLGISLSEVVADGLDEDATLFLEVSSFQAQGMGLLKAEDVIWTNFAPDHLDHHRSLSDYFNAKSGLLDCLVTSEAAYCGQSVVEFAKQNQTNLRKKVQVIKPLSDAIISKTENPFWCTFPQRENLALARAFALNSGVDEKVFWQAVDSYQPEPFRMSLTGRVGEVSFWNDSKATNLAATTAACKSFAEKVIWIGGGKPKGEKLESFSRNMCELIKHAFLIGEVAGQLSMLFQQNKIGFTICKTLKEAISKAFERAKGNAEVLFSPGFASFDMFRNYLERGNLFDELVFDLKKSLSPCTQGNKF